jgi:hypothetical protein
MTRHATPATATFIGAAGNKLVADVFDDSTSQPGQNPPKREAGWRRKQRRRVLPSSSADDVWLVLASCRASMTPIRDQPRADPPPSARPTRGRVTLIPGNTRVGQPLARKMAQRDSTPSLLTTTRCIATPVELTGGPPKSILRHSGVELDKRDFMGTPAQL